MAENNVWLKAQSLQWQVPDHIVPGFDIGFDQQIPADTENELRSFVKWVEQNYRIPITLWVDFEYKHYLVRRDGKRVGYLFYRSDISPYPVFDCKEEIPEIRLPVRTERSSIEEILSFFIEAITDYYAWLCQEITDEYIPDEDLVESILREYWQYRSSTASA